MDLVFQCPHCLDFFVIAENELNCRIVRHAVWKDTLEPIPPHSTQEECERVVRENLVFGCAKPVQINGTTPLPCGYI
jgi:hypothetical protein